MSASCSHLMAELLIGSWHRKPPCTSRPHEDLLAVTSLLQQSGAGGLAWWQVRESSLRDTPAGRELQQAFRLHTLHSARDELYIKEVFGRFRQAGIEPLLFKGWAIARLYPAKGLRPFGDIDLFVRPRQRQLAEQVLNNGPETKYAVDLGHKEFAGLSDAAVEALYDNSQLVRLDDTEIRLLSDEDHLRFLCLHLLRHGAWRPLWLCDIAVAVESRGKDFDWQRCLTGDKHLADWVLCTLRLAHELLGADISNTPAEAKKLPDWLLPTVLKQWEKPLASDHQIPESIFNSLRRPWRLPAAFGDRWLDPISASIKVRAPFNNLPRAPFQVAALFSITGNFLYRLPKWLARNRKFA